MASSHLLMEVPPSPSNVVGPPETNMIQHWVAVDGGRFKECPEHAALDVWMKSIKKPSKCITRKSSRKPVKTIAKYSPPSLETMPLEVIPRKKDRSESHPMLNQRVYVLWPEEEGPTRFYGKVIKYDSSRAKQMYVQYDDGEKWWEPEDDVISAAPAAAPDLGAAPAAAPDRPAVLAMLASATTAKLMEEVRRRGAIVPDGAYRCVREAE